MYRNILMQYGAVAFIALATILGDSSGRELRPSDHGLAYEENSSPSPMQNGEAEDMLSFFGATTTTTTPSMQLPEAKNISDAWVSEGRSRDIGIDHVRLGLLAATAVCGITGVVLLAVSAIVFLYRLQKQRSKCTSTSALTSLPRSHSANKNSG